MEQGVYELQDPVPVNEKKEAALAAQRPKNKHILSSVPHEVSLSYPTTSDTYCASDAELKIAFDLILALQNIKDEKWKPGDIDYRSRLIELIPRIRDILVQKVGSRLILTVSDFWGEADYKNAVTFNPSYADLSAIYMIARLMHLSDDRANAEFFMQLLKDSFDAILASYNWGEKIYADIKTLVAEQEGSPFINLEGRYANLLNSMLLHIKAPRKQPKDLEKAGIIIKDGSYAFKDMTHFSINRDGTWEIETGALKKAIQLIETNNVNLFFPDQIELEVKDGQFIAREEKGALNLGPTEGMDAIRVYSELGQFLLLTNKLEKDVPLLSGEFSRYDVRLQAANLLKDVMPYRKSRDVVAERYHNIVAISNYMLAQAGLGDKEAYTDFAREFAKYEDLNDCQHGVPQYYNTFTALRLQKFHELVASDRKIDVTLNLNDDDKNIVNKHYPRLQRMDKPLPKIMFGNRFLNFAIRANLRDYDPRKISLIFSPGEFLDFLKRSPNYYGLAPVTRLEQRKKLLGITDRQLTHDHEGLEKIIEVQVKEKNPTEVFLLASSLLDAGCYREASKVFFYLVKHIPSPRTTDERIILDISLAQTIGVNRVLNVSFNEIADTFEWFTEHNDICQGEKGLYIRTYYLQLLNQIERTGEAVKQAEIVLEKYYKAYGRTDLFYSIEENARQLRYKGKNLSSPLERQKLLGKIMAESVFALSRTSIAYLHPEYHILEREFNYQEALQLLSCLLSEGPCNTDPLPDKKLSADKKSLSINLLYQYDVRRSRLVRFNKLLLPLKELLPEEMLVDLVETKARILERMAGDIRDQEAMRGFISSTASTRETGNVAGYAKRIQTIGFALEQLSAEDKVLDRALAMDMRGQRKISFGILKTKISFYLLSAELVRMKKGLVSYIIHYPTQLTKRDKVIRDRLLASRPSVIIPVQPGEYFARAKKILDTVIKCFESPIANYFKPSRLYTTELTPSEQIADAAQRLVADLAPTDPRRAIHFEWLKQELDYIKSKITNLSSSDARFDVYVAEGLEVCAKMSKLKVDDALLNTQHLHESVIQTGEVLYGSLEQRLVLTTNLISFLKNASDPNYSLSTVDIKKKNLLNGAYPQLGIEEIIEKLRETARTDKAKVARFINSLYDLTLPQDADLKEFLDIRGRLADTFMEVRERKAIQVLYLALLTEYIPSQDDLSFIEKYKLLPMLNAVMREKKTLKQLYLIESSFESNAWTILGNLTWWGESRLPRINQALGYYKKALSLDPYNVQALCGRSQVFLRQASLSKKYAPTAVKARKKYQTLLMQAYRTILKATSALAGGINFSSDNIKTTTRILSTIVHEPDLDLPGAKQILKILSSGRTLTAYDCSQIAEIARRVNFL
ncbi:MAG: hypothetical protein ABIB65_00220 [Candidatus Margulisiibacteriota bacterium]